LLQRNSTNASSIESVMRARFGGMINPLCKNTRSTGADDEAILNDMVKSRSLLPAFAFALQFEASKWQGQGLKCQAKVNAMTTEVKAHTAKFSHCCGRPVSEQ